MILLSAQNLSKTYLERTVLNDVSFFLNEGDRVGIVGINGTGKSTLLRILSRCRRAGQRNSHPHQRHPDFLPTANSRF